MIDDELDFINLLQDFLTKAGYKVTAFTDPLKGLEYVQSNKFEDLIVIVDWRMPYMNGLIFANRIRLWNNMVKIVMLTAYDIGIVKIQPEYETAKLDHILQKPIKLLFLKKLLNQIIENLSTWFYIYEEN